MKRKPSGKVKVYAHRLVNHEAIPIFRDNALNREINAHVRRIQRVKTKRLK